MRWSDTAFFGAHAIHHIRLYAKQIGVTGKHYAAFSVINTFYNNGFAFGKHGCKLGYGGSKTQVLNFGKN